MEHIKIMHADNLFLLSNLSKNNGNYYKRKYIQIVKEAKSQS